jgi:hypothetical protein
MSASVSARSGRANASRNGGGGDHKHPGDHPPTIVCNDHSGEDRARTEVYEVRPPPGIHGATLVVGRVCRADSCSATDGFVGVRLRSV